MACAFYLQDYLNRKLSGEDVVHAASIYGYHACSTVPAMRHFCVLVMNKEDYSVYNYRISDGRFHVQDFKEAENYSISDVITSDMLHDKAVTRWWENVFFEYNNVCTYDSYYDTLKIADGSEVTFGELLEKTTPIIASLHLPTVASCLFLAGSLANNRLIRHVLQKVTGTEKIATLPEISGKEHIKENEIVTLPAKLHELSLNTNVTIRLDSLTLSPAHITLPLDAVESRLISNFRWKDAISDMREDYKAADINFKNVNVRVECDSFKNIFLSCQDLRGNKKVIQIN